MVQSYLWESRFGVALIRLARGYVCGVFSWLLINKWGGPSPLWTGPSQEVSVDRIRKIAEGELWSKPVSAHSEISMVFSSVTASSFLPWISTLTSMVDEAIGWSKLFPPSVMVFTHSNVENWEGCRCDGIDTVFACREVPKADRETHHAHRPGGPPQHADQNQFWNNYYQDLKKVLYIGQEYSPQLTDY